MKKIIIAFLVVFSFFIGIAGPAVAYMTAEAIRGTPVIDGHMEDIWNDSQVIEVKKLILGYNDSTIAEKAATGVARMLWDESCLYVFAEVTDGHLNKNPLFVAPGDVHRVDSIEFFIDEDNSKGQSYDSNDAQYRVDIERVKTGGFNARLEEFEAVVVKTDTGYKVEAAVPFTVSPVEGATIGFDIQINDDQGSGDRVAITTWCQEFGNAWKDPSEFGELLLTGPERDKKDNDVSERSSAGLFDGGERWMVLIGLAVVAIAIAAFIISKKGRVIKNKEIN